MSSSFSKFQLYSQNFDFFFLHEIISFNLKQKQTNKQTAVALILFRTK